MSGGQARVLATLAERAPMLCSHEELCRSTGLTRLSVQQMVSRIRARYGYGVIATRQRRGYALVDPGAVLAGLEDAS